MPRRARHRGAPHGDLKIAATVAATRRCIIAGSDVRSPTMPRRLLIALFLSLLIGLVVAGPWYIWQRLVVETELGQPWRTIALLALLALGSSWFVQPVAGQFLSPARQRVIAWPAAMWMGGAWLFVVALA